MPARGSPAAATGLGPDGAHPRPPRGSCPSMLAQGERREGRRKGASTVSSHAVPDGRSRRCSREGRFARPGSGRVERAGRAARMAGPQHRVGRARPRPARLTHGGCAGQRNKRLPAARCAGQGKWREGRREGAELGLGATPEVVMRLLVEKKRTGTMCKEW
jgi:hypothetical protein